MRSANSRCSQPLRQPDTIWPPRTRRSWCSDSIRHSTTPKLRTAIRAALAEAAIIATNPDVLTPVHDGYDPCVGVMTAAVVAAVPSVMPIVVGKPHPFLIEQALEHLVTAKRETIMFGDQLATDIAAGNAAGLRSILLASDVPFNAATGVVPDRVVSSLLDLLDAASKRAGPLS
ncbi:HAD hydrolase-like protein [Bradyrhizobium sp. CSA207]|uniref:HAD hydrolase-like protein n=1 Tax=Bradyrhizobium sp. CSA207 TaxID=2698826 RepID=UPI0031846193